MSTATRNKNKNATFQNVRSVAETTANMHDLLLYTQHLHVLMVGKLRA
ncbi:hypothetical protein [Spirosoma radiotolerans]|nr:hypothetical protein [Spirosoma radiotolerans]